MQEPLVQPIDPGPVLTIGSLEIRPTELQVFAHGARVGFTVREFQTFFVLAQRFDRVVTRQALYSLVWGGDMPRRDPTVDAFLRKERRQRSHECAGMAYLQTPFRIPSRTPPAPHLPPDLPPGGP